MTVRFILSIDGGGIRGLIPAIIIEELARRLKGPAMHEVFDLIGGTSTGGIIAAGLTCPNPRNRNKAACTPGDLVKLYADEGKDIFYSRLISKIINIGGWQEERYSAATLEEKLQARLGANTLIADGLTKVLITAYDIHQREAVFMTNCDMENAKFRFWEAARGSSAAPTYFEPALVENLAKPAGDEQRKIPLIDGGVFANDPVLAAYVEARKLWQAASDSFVVLSLGTGRQNRKIPYQQAKDWGAFGWINPQNGTPLISVLMQGQASTAAYQANKLLNPKGAKLNAEGSTDMSFARPETLAYFRIDGKLQGANDDLDDASATNIEQLKTVAQRFIADNGAVLDAVVSRIKAEKKV